MSDEKTPTPAPSPAAAPAPSTLQLPERPGPDVPPPKLPEVSARRPPGRPVPPSTPESGWMILVKIVAFGVLGIFVLGGLVFATCLLSFRR